MNDKIPRLYVDLHLSILKATLEVLRFFTFCMFESRENDCSEMVDRAYFGAILPLGSKKSISPSWNSETGIFVSIS